MIVNDLVAYLNNMPGFSGGVSAVVGAILTAIFLRRNTATQEFEKIKANKFSEVINDLLDSGKMTMTEYYKTKNFLEIAKIADGLVKKENNNLSDKKYSFDWFIRYYEAAGNISDKDMQILWAKILAGEVEKPSSYSLRTLDVLRNISKKEAELFLKVYSASMEVSSSQQALPNDKEYMQNNKICYSDILTLDEIGLINSSGSVQIIEDLDGYNKRILYKYGSLIVYGNASEKINLSLHVFPLTSVGNELASLIDKKNNEIAFLHLCQRLKYTNPKASIMVYRIISENGENVKYDEKNLLDSMGELNEY